MIPTRFGKKDLKLMKESFSGLHGRLLDIGCGNMLDRIGFTPGEEYIGVDITRSKYTKLLADIHKLPFKNGSFDCCICNAVLEHVKEPEIALIECNRILRSGGVIWISVPFLQYIHADHDFRRFTGKELAYEVQKAGFHVEWLHGNFGIIDNIEYLLFGAFVWKVNDALMLPEGLTKYLEKNRKKRLVVWEVTKGLIKNEGAVGVTYIFLIALLFVLFRGLGIIFDSQQRKDLHHATSFDMIAYKN